MVGKRESLVRGVNYYYNQGNNYKDNETIYNRIYDIFKYSSLYVTFIIFLQPTTK